MLRNRLIQVTGLALLLAFTPEFLAPAQVQAQCTPSVRCVTVGADGKGILGLGIIGAEIGFMIPALFVSAGVREFDEWWAYVLFPVVFAAGGAVAGYFALEEPTQVIPPTPTSPARRVNGYPEAAVAVLAVGMALIVPTFVGVLALTQYNPGSGDGAAADSPGATGEEDAADDEPAAEEEPANDAVREDEATSALRRTLAGGPGLFRYDQGQLLLGIPMAYATDSFTQEERDHMRLSGSQDYIVPVASGVF